MFCVQCGTKLEEGTKFCTECGAPLSAPKAVYPPKTPETAQPQTPPQPAVVPGPVQPIYASQRPVPVPQPVSVQPSVPAKSRYKGLLIGAILFTAFAYLTSNLIALGLGIIAIVLAAKAGKKEKAGALEEAKASARSAKALNITVLVLDIIWVITLIIALVVLVRAAIQTSSMVAGDTPEAVQEFLRQYGYEYDLELIREFMEQNQLFLFGF